MDAGRDMRQGKLFRSGGSVNMRFVLNGRGVLAVLYGPWTDATWCLAAHANLWMNHASLLSA